MAKSLEMNMLVPSAAAAIQAQASRARAALTQRHTESVIGGARHLLGLTLAETAAAVGASERTVARWLAGETAPSPAHRAKVEDLAEVQHLLRAVFPDQETALEWAHTSVPALRGRTPVGELSRGHLDRVLEVLATLESGAFV